MVFNCAIDHNSQRHVTTQSMLSLLQVIPRVFNIHDTSNSQLPFQGNSAMDQAQLLSGDLHTAHMTSSYITTSRHENVCINNSWQNKARAVCETTLHLSFHDATGNMQHDLSGSYIGWGHLAWPQVKFSDWVFRVKNYIFRRVMARGIRRC